METRWRIELLGGLRAVRGDCIVTRFRTRKAGALLSYLAYHPHRFHEREELSHLLWPDGRPETARTNLRVAFRLLRRQLEPSGAAADALFVADRASIQLKPDAIVTDVAEFQALIEAAKGFRGAPEEVTVLTRAVEVYRGELLPGSFEDWVLLERQWLAERYFLALSQLLARLERAGDFDRAVECARRGVSADPLREEAQRDLIRLLAAVDQPAAALRQYHELERLLRENLRATPSGVTRALAREIERLALLRPQPVRPAPVPAARAAGPGAEAAELAPGEPRLVSLLAAEARRTGTTARAPHRSPVLQAIVDVVLKYEGRIGRFQAEGVLAAFGVPQTRENDPERATLAALEIREVARGLGWDVRAGIHTGEVDLDALDRELPTGMTPDTLDLGRDSAVDLAVRLQGQAQPGQIVVSEVTRHLTRRAFAFSPPMLVTGDLERSMTSFVVEGALPRPKKARGIEGLRAPLIGRDRELEILQAALTETRQGRGQMVSLIGEAGVGKSRLVAELKAAVGLTPPPAPPRSGEGRTMAPLSSEFPPLRFGEGGRGEGSAPPVPLWLKGRCLELGMTASYSLFVDLFRDYFGTRSDAEECRPAAAIVAALHECVARGDLSAERADEMGPLLGHLLSLCFGNVWDLRLKNTSPEQIRYQTLLAMRDFFVALARQQPLVFVLEDLHWADSLSLDLIALLMEALTGGGDQGETPLLMLCVYRPDHEHKCGYLATIASRKCPERYTELPLRELTPAQSRRLLESLIATDHVPAGVTDEILARSHGNPFFLEEIVCVLIDTGRLYRYGDLWRAREGSLALAVPESIQSVIQSRVDRLGSRARQVLASAAVLGRVFRRRVLERMVGEELAAERALWELSKRGLIYPERVVPEEEYSFKHVLTQQAIYDRLAPQQRTALHQQAGDAIEALYAGHLEEHSESLAYHYERSAADEKAVTYLLMAGEKARRDYLNDEAIGYFRRLLERLDGETEGRADGARKQDPAARPVAERRLAALRGLGQIHHGMGNEPDAAECFRQAIAIGQEIGSAPRDLVRLFYWLSEVLFWQERFQEMIQIGEEGLALLGKETESVEAALMYSAMGEGYLHTGDEEKWREFILRPAETLERLPYSEELRPAYLHIGEVYEVVDKNVEEAMKWYRLLEQRARQQQDWIGLGAALHSVGQLSAVQGELRAAIPQYQRALEACQKTGDLRGQGWILHDLAAVFLVLGNLPRAEECASLGIETTKSAEAKWISANLHLVKGRILLWQGRWAEAAALFQGSQQLYRELDSLAEFEATLGLGHASLAQGEQGEALAHFQAALAVGRTSPALLAAALSRLDHLFEDLEAFRAFCHRFREEHPELSGSPLVQWFLEPAEDLRFSVERMPNVLGVPLASEWVWQDPVGDCVLEVQNGPVFHAANGRDLWWLNMSAPRLLRPISGAFAVQTVCAPVSEEKPAMGGLLLWKDRQNFLRLDWGSRGRCEVAFLGCLGNKDVIRGRGRLTAGRVSLRLECCSGHVNALCSADGQDWFSVGHVEFPVTGPIEAGLYATGSIDRTLYPGAYPEGTAIRFESLELLR